MKDKIKVIYMVGTAWVNIDLEKIVSFQTPNGRKAYNLITKYKNKE